jgi:hypothetical protein
MLLKTNSVVAHPASESYTDLEAFVRFLVPNVILHIRLVISRRNP